MTHTAPDQITERLLSALRLPLVDDRAVLVLDQGTTARTIGVYRTAERALDFCASVNARCGENERAYVLTRQRDQARVQITDGAQTHTLCTAALPAAA